MAPFIRWPAALFTVLSLSGGGTAAAAVSSCAASAFSASVAFATGDSSQFPRAVVALEASSTSCEVRAVWGKVGATLPPLATAWKAAVTSSDFLSLPRVTPKANTSFAVYVRDAAAASASNDDNQGELVFETSLTVPGTPWPFLEQGQFVQNLTLGSGVAKPSWEMLALDVHSYDSDPPFSGFVVVDGEGDVVWMWNISTPTATSDMGPFPTHCIDQRVVDTSGAPPAFSFLMQSMVSDAPLGLVDASSGELDEVFPYDNDACPAKIITHEARLSGSGDGSNGDAAYAVEVTWGEFEGLAHPQMGDRVVMWTFTEAGDGRLMPATGADFASGPRREKATNSSSSSSSSYEVLYDLFDYFDPVTERGLLSDGK